MQTQSDVLMVTHAEAHDMIKGLYPGDPEADRDWHDAKEHAFLHHTNNVTTKRGWAPLPKDFLEICTKCKAKIDYVVYSTKVITGWVHWCMHGCSEPPLLTNFMHACACGPLGLSGSGHDSTTGGAFLPG